MSEEGPLVQPPLLKSPDPLNDNAAALLPLWIQVEPPCSATDAPPLTCTAPLDVTATPPSCTDMLTCQPPDTLSAPVDDTDAHTPLMFHTLPALCDHTDASVTDAAPRRR